MEDNSECLSAASSYEEDEHEIMVRTMIMMMMNADSTDCLASCSEEVDRLRAAASVSSHASINRVNMVESPSLSLVPSSSTLPHSGETCAPREGFELLVDQLHCPVRRVRADTDHNPLQHASEGTKSTPLIENDCALIPRRKMDSGEPASEMAVSCPPAASWQVHNEYLPSALCEDFGRTQQGDVDSVHLPPVVMDEDEPLTSHQREFGSHLDGGALPRMDAQCYGEVPLRSMDWSSVVEEAVRSRPNRRHVRISSHPQTAAARHRRERISLRIRILQRLVPGGIHLDTVSMLEEAVRYLKCLKKLLHDLHFATTTSTSSQHLVPSSSGLYAAAFNPAADLHGISLQPNLSGT